MAAETEDIQMNHIHRRTCFGSAGSWKVGQTLNNFYLRRAFNFGPQAPGDMRIQVITTETGKFHIAVQQRDQTFEDLMTNAQNNGLLYPNPVTKQATDALYDLSAQDEHDNPWTYLGANELNDLLVVIDDGPDPDIAGLIFQAGPLGNIVPSREVINGADVWGFSLPWSHRGRIRRNVNGGNPDHRFYYHPHMPRNSGDHVDFPPIDPRLAPGQTIRVNDGRRRPRPKTIRVLHLNGHTVSGWQGAP